MNLVGSVLAMGNTLDHHQDAVAALAREVARLSEVVDRQTKVLSRQAEVIEQLAARLAADSSQDDGLPAVENRQPQPVGIKGAADHLGIHPRTLRRALKAGAAELPGGPHTKSPGAKRNHWVFDLRTTKAWWTRWEEHRRPAKARGSQRRAPRRTKTQTTKKKTGKKDWAKIAREASTRGPT